MAEITASNETVVEAEETAQSWASTWQLPVLLLGLSLLAISVWFALPDNTPEPLSVGFDTVRAEIKAANLERADELLKKMEDAVSQRATPLERGEYMAIWGNLVYAQQNLNKWDNAANNRKINEYYGEAEKFGYKLAPVQYERWAEALVGLDRYEEARKRIDKLTGNDRQTRFKILKSIIHRRMDRGANSEELFVLLEDYYHELMAEGDQKFVRREVIWATVTKAGILLEMDSMDAAGQAKDLLVSRLTRLKIDGRTDDLAPIEVKLAQAYQALGELSQAETYFNVAAKRLSPTDALNATILVGLGQIKLVQIDFSQLDGVQDALMLFKDAEERFPTTPAHLAALIGRAHCEALLSRDSDAIEHFAEAVDELVEHGLTPERTRVQLANRLRDHHDLKDDKGEYETALSYLEKVHPLYPKELPRELLGRFAVTHSKIAEEKKAATEQVQLELGMTDEQRQRATEARRALNIASNKHFDAAGDYFLMHATSSFSIGDLDAFADTLWKAAEAYDAAERWTKSIDAYRQFASTLESHSLQLEAARRLGMAYLSKGIDGTKEDFRTARDQFLKLIKEHPNTEPAIRSLVPLAQAYVNLGEDEDAERTLRYVVEDHETIGPENQEYRKALIELGKLLYRQGRYARAIEKLDVAVTRFGDTRDGPVLKYLLADAYRRSVDEISEEMKKPMPQSRLLALNEQRTVRLERAQSLYTDVVNALEAMPTDMQSDLEKVYHRNAYFFRGDCAYELQRWDEARRLYSRAAKRFEHDPASLIAYIQIVNAYSAEGRVKDARVANKVARWALERFDEASFDDPNLPMPYKYWEEWLRWSNELNLVDSVSPASLLTQE